MIAGLVGALHSVAADTVTVDVNGVIYRVFGKRTASRILLDLRGKLPENLEPTGPPRMRSDPEVLGALQALGYSTAEALTAISNLPEDAKGSTEDQVVEALRILGGT